MEGLETKRKMLRSILKNIFNNVGVNVPYYDCSKLQEKDEKYQPARLHLKGYDIRLARFNSDGITNYKNVFEYVFTTEEPKYANKSDDKIDLEKTFTKALTWLNDFFCLEVEPAKMIQTDNLTDWGNRLYNCYMKLLRLLFTGNGDGEDEAINWEQLRIDLSDIIKSLLDIDIKTSESVSPPSEMNEFEFPDMTPAQLAKVSRQIRKAMPTPEPEDFLNQPQHSLPHRKPSMKYDEREHYTYEELNEDVDHIIKVLSELPDELDDVQKCSLYRIVDELCGYRKYFRYNLSLEKKQHTLSTLESTADRFFKDVIGQSLPPKSSVCPEEWQACFDKGRASAALEMCIRILKLLIDNETNKKTD